MAKKKEEEVSVTETEAINQIPPEAQEMLDKLLSPQADTIMDNEQKMGVLQRLVQAVYEDKENQFRQTLHTANFPDAKAAHLCAAAINECLRLGVGIGPIMNHVETENGIRGEAKNKIMEALTHYTFSTNYQGQKNRESKSKRTPL